MNYQPSTVLQRELAADVVWNRERQRKSRNRTLLKLGLVLAVSTLAATIPIWVGWLLAQVAQ